MYCQHCGAEIDDDALFCRNCGKSTGIGDSSRKAPRTREQKGNPQSGKAPGKYQMLVAGIILTIFAFVGLIQSLPLIGPMTLIGLGGLAIFELLCVTIFCLIIGICSIARCNRLDENNVVGTLAALAILLRIIDWIWSANVAGELGGSLPVGGIILSIIILAIIYYGGQKNETAAKNLKACK